MGFLSGKINEGRGSSLITAEKREKTLGDYASEDVSLSKVGRSTVSRQVTACAQEGGLDRSRALRKRAAERAKMVVPPEWKPVYTYYLNDESVGSYDEANQPGGRVEVRIGGSFKTASYSGWRCKLAVPEVAKYGDRYHFV